MKKRIVLLTTLAAMLVAAMALSGVAQAAPISDRADAQCAKLAVKTLGPSFNPSNYTFIGGTEGDDFSLEGTANVPDVFCGFGGIDQQLTLDEGDIFLGGAERDVVNTNYGTVYGGAGNDRVLDNYGTFYGEEGDDLVFNNWAEGTVYGGAGNDEVRSNHGTFYGEEGDDLVRENFAGATFNGGAGNDVVHFNFPGSILIDVEVF
jgi:Ca2+-binding RTX toxin-like protein